ncbi:MAG: hypothetical protein ABR991_13200 [Terracidiphilus sp.]
MASPTSSGSGVEQSAGLGVALGLLRLFVQSVAQGDDAGIGLIDAESLLRGLNGGFEVALAARGLGLLHKIIDAILLFLFALRLLAQLDQFRIGGV